MLILTGVDFDRMLVRMVVRLGLKVDNWIKYSARAHIQDKLSYIFRSELTLCFYSSTNDQFAYHIVYISTGFNKKYFNF